MLTSRETNVSLMSQISNNGPHTGPKHGHHSACRCPSTGGLWDISSHNADCREKKGYLCMETLVYHQANLAVIDTNRYSWWGYAWMIWQIFPVCWYEYTAMESLFLHSSHTCGDYCMYGVTGEVQQIKLGSMPVHTPLLAMQYMLVSASWRKLTRVTCSFKWFV